MSTTHDLLQGSISLHFKRLAVPAAIGLTFTTLYNVVDVYFAGLLGTNVQAGIAIAFQAFFLTVTFGFGLSSAMIALVGNALGAKHHHQAHSFATQGIGFGFFMSAILLVVGYLIGPQLIKLITVPSTYRDYGIQYYSILLMSLPAFILAFGMNGLLQSQGDTVSMQQAQIGAFFANIVLNPLLIFGCPGILPGIGFNGIAVSTLMSQIGVMLYVGFKLFKTELLTGWKWPEFLPNINICRVITEQMLPSTLTMMLMMLSGFAVQFFLKTFGDSAVAAYGIALRVEQLFLLPVFGLTGALLPIAAQNYGAGKYDRVRLSLFTCWKFGWLFMLLVCPILLFASNLLMDIFTDDPEVIHIGVSYLRVDGFILPLYMMLFAMNSFLQALKRPIWPLWIGIYRQGFGVAFFTYLYVVICNLRVMGIWFGIATSVVTGLVLSLIVTQYVASYRMNGLWRSQQHSSYETNE